MSINERLNPPLWIEQLGITPLPTIYGWANAETGEMLYRVRNIPNPDLTYIFNAKQRNTPVTPPNTNLGLPFTTRGINQNVDGDFRRFVYDGLNTLEIGSDTSFFIWEAQLDSVNRKPNYVIEVKMPPLFGEQMFGIFIADTSELSILATPTINNISLSASGFDVTRVGLNIIGDPQNSQRPSIDPTAVGDIIRLEITDTQLVYSWPGGGGIINIPPGFFASNPNVIFYSAGINQGEVIDLSVRVLDTSPPTGLE